VNGVVPLSIQWRRGLVHMRWSACLSALVLACFALPARGALTPESPEVKAAVAKAVAFLATDGANDPRIGAQAMAGLALLKSEAPHDHPRILQAVQSIRQGLNDDSLRTDMYSLAMAIIFLVNADRDRYEYDIEKLLKLQGETQKPNGAWGYHNAFFGDTSMTQYAVLSMWEATEAGFDIPMDRWEQVANWLLRTQDPSGAFGYQAIDPGNFTQVLQPETRLSMCSAGSGSLYICSDRFGLVNLGPRDKRKPEDSLPDALKPVGKRRQRPDRKGTRNVDSRRMERARDAADEHMDRNFAIEVDKYPHYYLYTMERYQSFREAASGRIAQDSEWYDAGVRYLLAKQGTRGEWDNQCGVMSDTAFSVLFMVRSTRKAITRARYYGGGTLVGGRGLPHGEGSALLRQGRIKRQATAGPADELFAAMDDPDNELYFRAIEDLEELSFEADIEDLDSMAAQLKRLVSDGPVEARVAAVRGLARTRNLDHAPTLIFALDDPDAEVFREAAAGLRLMSRRLKAPAPPAAPSEKERQDEIRIWQDWYRSIRPGATFDALSLP